MGLIHERNGVPEGDQVPRGSVDRTCIEYCSGKQGPHTQGCKRVRLTIEDDLTTKKGLDRAMQAVDDAQRVSPGRLLLWAAIPCIGGCLWQRLNRRYPRARARIEQHRVVWRRLWDNFVLVAEKAMLLGAVVVIESPQQCDYWGRKMCDTLPRAS